MTAVHKRDLHKYILPGIYPGQGEMVGGICIGAGQRLVNGVLGPIRMCTYEPTYGMVCMYTCMYTII